MLIHVCGLCGYEYETEENGFFKGEKESDFAELDGEWRCPECGASKEAFDEDEREDGE
jgi:rubredoxin